MLARGRDVLLRDALLSDADRFVHWWGQGEWRRWDAPWEGIRVVTSDEQAEKDREHFVKHWIEGRLKLRREAIMALPDGQPIGSVGRYGREGHPRTTKVGISIREEGFSTGGWAPRRCGCG